MSSGYVGWRAATEQALYGDRGFFRRTAPAAHFRTAAHVPRFAEAMAVLVDRVDRALGRPEVLDVVDVGAGRGELLGRLSAAVPAEIAARARWTAVEIADRPTDLPPAVDWAAMVPQRITGLVLATEWLDNVPVDVVVRTDDGPRLLLVDPTTGVERIGPAPEPADVRWLERWWPLLAVGDRAELGGARDAAWAGVVGGVQRGLAVAVDYSHDGGGRPSAGSLTGYRGGRQVPPIPDGTCDITAHVALDACAHAVGRPYRLTTQRDALRELGVSGDGSGADGALDLLVRAGQEGELLDPHGLGGFGWLEQPVRIDWPGASVQSRSGASIQAAT